MEMARKYDDYDDGFEVRRRPPEDEEPVLVREEKTGKKEKGARTRGKKSPADHKAYRLGRGYSLLFCRGIRGYIPRPSDAK